MTTSNKPHLGKIKGVAIHNTDKGLGFLVYGVFDGHPNFDGMYGHTSYVVAHDEETGEIETRNSRYTWVYADER